MSRTHGIFFKKTQRQTLVPRLTSPFVVLREVIAVLVGRSCLLDLRALVHGVAVCELSSPKLKHCRPIQERGADGTDAAEKGGVEVTVGAEAENGLPDTATRAKPSNAKNSPNHTRQQQPTIVLHTYKQQQIYPPQRPPSLPSK